MFTLVDKKMTATKSSKERERWKNERVSLVYISALSLFSAQYISNGNFTAKWFSKDKKYIYHPWAFTVSDASDYLFSPLQYENYLLHYLITLKLGELSRWIFFKCSFAFIWRF